MDLALIVIDKQTLELQFSGANNAAYLARNGELTTLKPCKMPIAIYYKEEGFKTQKHQLQKGDMLFLGSDGYADQFGGKNNRKFMIRNLRALFTEISSLPASEQHSILENTLENWMKDQSQIDDITMLGIRV